MIPLPLTQAATVFGQALLPVILLAGAGALADRWLKLDLRTLARLNIYLLSPALLFSSLMAVEVKQAEAGRVVAFTVLVLMVMAAVGWLYARVRHLGAAETSGAILAVTFFNAVNLGFPFILFAYGEEGLKLAAVLIAASSLPHNGFALFVAARGVLNTRRVLTTIARMPMLYAIILALLFRFTGVSVPAAVAEPVALLGRAGIPVLLATIGMELGRLPFNARDPDVWGAVGLRLLVGPLVAWGVADLVGLTGLLRAVVIVQASMPSAIMPIVFAREFGGAVGFVSRAVLYSTLLSVVSLSVLLVVLGTTLPY